MKYKIEWFTPILIYVNSDWSDWKGDLPPSVCLFCEASFPVTGEVLQHMRVNLWSAWKWLSFCQSLFILILNICAFWLVVSCDLSEYKLLNGWCHREFFLSCRAFTFENVCEVIFSVWASNGLQNVKLKKTSWNNVASRIHKHT